jgi:hypothetical protein
MVVGSKTSSLSRCHPVPPEVEDQLWSLVEKFEDAAVQWEAQISGRALGLGAAWGVDFTPERLEGFVQSSSSYMRRTTGMGADVVLKLLGEVTAAAGRQDGVVEYIQGNAGRLAGAVPVILNCHVSYDMI